MTKIAIITPKEQKHVMYLSEVLKHLTCRKYDVIIVSDIKEAIGEGCELCISEPSADSEVPGRTELCMVAKIDKPNIQYVDILRNMQLTPEEDFTKLMATVKKQSKDINPYHPMAHKNSVDTGSLSERRRKQLRNKRKKKRRK
jgi:hypothetical protein